MRTLSNSRPTVVVACVAMASVLIEAGCSPYVYKDDIAVFSKGVDVSATAFDALSRAGKCWRGTGCQELTELAEGKTVVSISADCTDVTHRQLFADTRCLAAWAAFRATPEGKRGPTPRCPGARVRAFAGANMRSTTLLLLPREKLTLCKLGIKKKMARVDPGPIDNAEIWVTSAPRLLPALKGYTTALVGIADAADREALLQSVGKAKDQIGQARHDPSTDWTGRLHRMWRQSGPSADVVGTALVIDSRPATLSRPCRCNHRRRSRRHQGGDDPVQRGNADDRDRVAGCRSCLFRVGARSAGKPAGDTDAWIQAYEKGAHGARRLSRGVRDESPRRLFKAMADAHHQLTLAAG